MNIGDIVFLKSGGPPMTITEVKGNDIAVRWSDPDQSHTFKTWQLINEPRGGS